ncbi:MAG: DegT/DnrJ/EryC1/StrS family aminotransferase [Flammeovirgaceae bacterium]|nr:DegT/DnrJ/EryC1/StrS family aminotransferase [Flammeovirgaceae bacterium]
MTVPFVDLQKQYVSIKSEIDSALLSVFSAGQFIKGSSVSTFESSFKKLIGADYCIGTGNGTDSLFLSLKALGIGSGDEVLTPAFSWISSAEVISLTGAKPVFIDIEPLTFTMNPDLVEDKITKNTKAIILVHLFGSPANTNHVLSICKKYNLSLIEDCAQSHLSEENGKVAGTIGHVSAFSFYPTKNLGAYGDAGCLVTNDKVLAEVIRRLANHGALQKDDHRMEGLNSRMDELQAAILNVKINHLKTWNDLRIQHANSYDKLLDGVSEITTPARRPGTRHTFHAYVIRAKKRDELKKYLVEKGVETVIHYPKALTSLPVYQEMGFREKDFPIASRAQDEVLSLPIYPEISSGQIEYVCEMIKKFYKI